MIDATGCPQSLLVLGGTSDIAQAIAARLVADRTTRVVLAGRDPEQLEFAASPLRVSGARVDLLELEATETAGHPRVVEKAFEAGDVDVVLVAFGQLGDQDAAENDSTAAVALAQVNYVGAVSLMTIVANRLRQQGHGVLVVLSSVAGERPRRSNYVYGSTKAGLDAFSTGLGDALHGSGVHVLVVRPGFVKTRMTADLDPAPLATTPEAVADAVVEGIRRRRDTVYVPSTMRWVMSGLRHLPRTVFRRLPL